MRVMQRIFRTLLVFVLLAAADMKALTEGQLQDAYSYAYSPAGSNAAFGNEKAMSVNRFELGSHVARVPCAGNRQ